MDDIEELRKTIEEFVGKYGATRELFSLLADASIHAAILMNLPLQYVAQSYSRSCREHEYMLFLGMNAEDFMPVVEKVPSPEQQKHDEVARKLLEDFNDLDI